MLRELRHPFHRLLEPGAGLRARDITARAQQLIGGRVQRVDRASRRIRAFPRVGNGVGDRFTGPLHLLLRAAERLADRRRYQRVLPRRLPNLIQHPLQSLLDGALLGTERAAGVGAVAKCLLQGQLTLRQPAGFGQRLIESLRDFLPPLLLHALPLALKLVGERIQRPGRPLTRLPRLLPPAGATFPARLLHLSRGLPRLLARRVEALLSRRRVHRLGHLGERRGQRVGARGELLFRCGRAHAVGRRDLGVPLPLLLRQILGFLAQVGEVTFERGAAKQLLAPLQSVPQLLLGLGQPLEGVLGAVGVEILERLLQRRQALAKLRRERSVDLLADLRKLALPGRIPQAGRLGALPQGLQ